MNFTNLEKCELSKGLIFIINYFLPSFEDIEAIY